MIFALYLVGGNWQAACDLFIFENERNSSTQFFYCTSPGGQKLTSSFEVLICYFHSWSFRASQNDWFENLVWLRALLVCLFCTVFLDWWKLNCQNFFLHSGISGQIFLTSIFEVLDYHFHPASCSQKDRIELHLVQVHHCLVCSFGCRFLF